MLAISEKKYKDAEDIFRQLQQVTGGDPRVISGLVEAYKGENQSPRALQLLQDEVKRSPNSQTCLLYTSAVGQAASATVTMTNLGTDTVSFAAAPQILGSGNFTSDAAPATVTLSLIHI